MSKYRFVCVFPLTEIYEVEAENETQAYERIRDDGGERISDEQEIGEMIDYHLIPKNEWDLWS